MTAFDGTQEVRLYRLVERRCARHRRWDFRCLNCVQDMELTAREEAARIDRAWRLAYRAAIHAEHLDQTTLTQQDLIKVFNEIFATLTGEWQNGRVVGEGKTE